MASFSTALSGLNAFSQALSVVSNNLANLNTDAYKDVSPIFSDLFYQQLGTNGAGNPIQVGAGSAIASVASNFTQGNINSTGVPTDVAIQGSGFFVLGQNGNNLYTRDGNFSVNSLGTLVSNTGGSVLGYPAVNGVISPAQTLAPLTLSGGQTSPAHATSAVSLSMNLDASAPISAAVPPAVTAPVTFSTPLVVYDSLGQNHVLTFDFTKTAANAWSYSVSIPSADVAGPGGPVVLQSGNLTFDGSGKLTLPAAGSPVAVTATGFADGASDLNFSWNLYDATGNSTISQAASQSQTSGTQQDGYASGTLQSFSIDSNGTVSGVFSNGQNISLGQLALASFPDDEGLARAGSNNYQESLSSGPPVVGAPGTGGRGTVTGGALEGSNVDIATEFAKLITAERGYQANARVITTVDELTQAAIALKTNS